MANFTITVGPVTSAPVTVDALKAMQIVDNYLLSQGIEGLTTNQEKINALVIQVSEHIRSQAFLYKRTIAIQSAKTNTIPEEWE